MQKGLLSATKVAMCGVIMTQTQQIVVDVEVTVIIMNTMKTKTQYMESVTDAIKRYIR